MPIIFFPYLSNTDLSRLKMGSRKYGWDTPLPASHPISVFFSVNTETDGMNIEIRMEQDGIFPVRFHPYLQPCASERTHHILMLQTRPCSP